MAFTSYSFLVFFLIFIVIYWLIMFSFIVLGWGIFRAPSITWLLNVIFNTPFMPPQNELMLGLITLTMTFTYAIPLLIKNLMDTYPNKNWLQATYHAITVTLIIIYINSFSSDFIYVQF